MPSADELQLMSQLVAQLKGSSSGDQAPTVPNPSVPLGALLLGRLALGRRPEDEVAQGSQALFSANPTLQGGKLQNLQDWATQGDVSVASGAEDAVLTIAALANDQNADLPGLAPVVVVAPTHGTVATNADGSFSYTPQGL